MMAKRRDPRREAFWRRTLRRHAKSGMSVAEFCANEDLTTSAFYHWKKELQRRGGETPARQPAPANQTTLLPVQLLDDANGSAPVEVVTASGYVVRVSETATTDHLRRVLQAVSELG